MKPELSLFAVLFMLCCGHLAGTYTRTLFCSLPHSHMHPHPLTRLHSHLPMHSLSLAIFGGTTYDTCLYTASLNACLMLKLWCRENIANKTIIAKLLHTHTHTHTHTLSLSLCLCACVCVFPLICIYVLFSLILYVCLSTLSTLSHLSHYSSSFSN